jgi:large repetitive protein
LKAVSSPSRSCAWPLILMAVANLAAQTVPLTSTSHTLRFAHTSGAAAAPAPQVVNVFSDIARDFSATATTDSGGSWLLVNGASVRAGNTGNATAALSISVNISNLQPGTYTGRVTISVTGAAATDTIQVILTVAATPQLTLNPNYLNLTGTPGSATAATVTAGSTGTQLPYSAVVTEQAPATGWLSVAAPGSTGTSPITIVANPDLLGAQTVGLGTVTFTSPNGALTLPVTFRRTAVVSLVAPALVNFAFQPGFTTPASKPVTVTASSGAPAQFTAQVSSGAWLTLSNSSTTAGATIINGTTGTPFFVLVNPAGLQPGTHNGTVTISSPTVAGNLTINVRLVVSNSPLLLTPEDELLFNHTVGQTPPPNRFLTVGSTSGVLAYDVAFNSQSGGEWLQVNKGSGQTLGTITASLNSAQIPSQAGTYTGTIRITASGAGNSPLDIPARLVVSGSTLLNVSPGALSYTIRQGQVEGKSFQVTSTDGSNQPLTFTVDPATANWLQLPTPPASTGSTGAVVNVFANSAGLQPGSYQAAVVVTPGTLGSGAAQRVNVTLEVTPSNEITATPAQITLTQTGATPPEAQSVQLQGPAGQTFFISSNQQWFSVEQSASVFPATLTVRFNSANLTPGPYEGEISILSNQLPERKIPVKLTVQATATLAATPTQLNFAHRTGTEAPAAQPIAVTSNTVATPFTASATTASGGNWLSVNPASGTTNAAGGAAANVNVSVNPAGLTPATYTGTVTIRGQNTVTVAVNLVVSNPTPPAITAVQNAASNASTAVSPGLIMAIKGTNLGPATGVGGQVQGGVVTTTIGEVRVFFDGVAAPMLFARQDQVNVIAPYILVNRTSTRVVVEYRGIRSEPIDLRVAETAPGLFTLDASGNGQGAILNQNGSVNGANNPATRNSVIVLFATGEGQLIPAGADGKVITANDLRRPMAEVQARVGGMRATVEYAGSAVGLVSGGLQVNVRVPANLPLPAGANTAVPVELIIGSGTTTTTQNVTVVVRP